ncbi:hypothetical protein [Pseudomonas sp. KCJK8670]|uniref:hypothetical protein n=1 Tax=Pseudomonas sp. KCJK8670 TaxID=3344558 RepID=UPI003905B45C
MSDLNPVSLCGTVVESSIMPFSSDVSREAREDILLVVRFAHRVATEEKEEPLCLDWFTNYRRKLCFLGWDATPAPIVRHPGPSRERILERALSRIGQVGRPEHLAVAERSILALQRDPTLIKRLETRMREQNKTQIQLMPCVRRAGDVYDMVLFHMEMLELDSYKNLLFAKGELKMALHAHSAELIRFNLRLFRDQHKQLVLSRVLSKDRQLIEDLKL